MALLLGAYSVDLGYSVVFGMQQDVLNYLARVKVISGELGITGAFSPEVAERLEKNINNEDSLRFIILNSFNDVNSYFIENERQQVGIMVLAGGFIEGLYLYKIEITYEASENESKKTVRHFVITGEQLTSIIEKISEIRAWIIG